MRIFKIFIWKIGIFEESFLKFQKMTNSKSNSFNLRSGIWKNILKMFLCKTTALRWKSHLECHMVLILSRNQTSTHKEDFSCGTFSYQKSFVDEKQVQRGQSSNRKLTVPLARALPTPQYYSSSFT